ncbi:hypothetical protein E4K67_28980 [Desulfosporosinus fructosivorans]|uniref:Uncharacterized protein n=1 Tax=Desulfosporosinus fructosivorans TaxID=2018669 RepID=A0A4Z0QYE4_9FIRM|nr:hypothetical protein E4K67_28980 [Desulfosporosinus fructosivorans]
MAAIVFQTNKETGITYAYESVSYWDKEKQQSRAMRKLIGKPLKGFYGCCFTLSSIRSAST